VKLCDRRLERLIESNLSAASKCPASSETSAFRSRIVSTEATSLDRSTRIARAARARVHHVCDLVVSANSIQALSEHSNLVRVPTNHNEEGPRDPRRRIGLRARLVRAPNAETSPTAGQERHKSTRCSVTKALSVARRQVGKTATNDAEFSSTPLVHPPEVNHQPGFESLVG